MVPYQLISLKFPSIIGKRNNDTYSFLRVSVFAYIDKYNTHTNIEKYPTSEKDDSMAIITTHLLKKPI